MSAICTSKRLLWLVFMIRLRYYYVGHGTASRDLDNSSELNNNKNPRQFDNRVSLIDWSIFIHLARGSAAGAFILYKSSSLAFESTVFQVFRLMFDLSQVNLWLVQTQQAEIIIVKHLIERHINVTRVRVEPDLCDQGIRKELGAGLKFSNKCWPKKPNSHCAVELVTQRHSRGQEGARPPIEMSLMTKTWSKKHILCSASVSFSIFCLQQ